MSQPSPGQATPGRAKRASDPKTIIGAGSRAYGWVRDALRVYGTLVTLVQIVPAILALVVVFVSPTAWLSATLRRWVGMGALVGMVLGTAWLARVAGPRTLVDAVRGGRVRSGRLAGLGWWGIGTAVVAAALFRVHLAVVDVAFVQAVPVLTPVLDFYLGGGPAALRLYNVVAALLAAAAIAGVAAGAPAAVLRWRELRLARQEMLAEGGPAAALEAALKAVDAAKEALETSRRSVAAMAAELDELRAEAERGSDTAVETKQVPDPAPTSARGQPARPSPRAADGRSRH